MTMYQNKKTGVIAKYSNEENGGIINMIKDDGSEFTISGSTFKRWWKKIEVKNDDIAGDGTSFTQVMQEIIMDEQKQADSEGKSAEVVLSNNVDDVLANLITSGEKVYIDEAIAAIREAGIQEADIDIEYIKSYLENGGKSGSNKKDKKKKVKKEKKIDGRVLDDPVEFYNIIIEMAESLGYGVKQYDFNNTVGVLTKDIFVKNKKGEEKEKTFSVLDLFIGKKTFRVRTFEKFVPKDMNIEYEVGKNRFSATMHFTYANDLNVTKEFIRDLLNEIQKEVA